MTPKPFSEQSAERSSSSCNIQSKRLLHNNIRLLTADRSECIDHIAVSEGFVADADITVDEWNYDKRLSDHKGIYVDLRW